MNILTIYKNIDCTEIVSYYRSQDINDLMRMRIFDYLNDVKAQSINLDINIDIGIINFAINMMGKDGTYLQASFNLETTTEIDFKDGVMDCLQGKE